MSACIPSTSPEYPKIGWIEGHDEQGRAVFGWHSTINGKRYGEVSVCASSSSKVPAMLEIMRSGMIEDAQAIALNQT